MKLGASAAENRGLLNFWTLPMQRIAALTLALALPLAGAAAQTGTEAKPAAAKPAVKASACCGTACRI